MIGRLLHRFDLAVAVFFALSGFLLWRGHAAAARDLGTSSAQIMKDLNQLWLCGLPGYTPGDLIDLSFTEDSVAVTFSAGIDRPLRLTAAEAAPMLEETTFILNETPLVDEAPSAPRNGLDDEFTDEFQLNLADLPLDADWDSLSPFKPDAPKGRAARDAESTVKAPEPVVDPSFKSNLHELPEVFELDHLGEPEEAEPLPLAEADEELVFDLGDDDLDHLAARQENIMRLNLALAYIDQGDMESACNILNEVIDQGDEEQKQEARELLARIA